jgi:hypothetical protein
MLIGRSIEVKEEAFAPLPNPSAEIKFASSEFRLRRLAGAQIRTPDPRIVRAQTWTTAKSRARTTSVAHVLAFANFIVTNADSNPLTHALRVVQKWAQ